MRNINSLVAAAFILSLSLFAIACKKEGCTDPNATNYSAEAKDDDGSCQYPEPMTSFDISAPLEDAVYSLNQTVHINAVITTDEEPHGYEIYIRNTSNNDEVVFSVMDHAHTSPISIHEEWINTVQQHSDMELEIRLIIDHDGNYLSEAVNFHCHPM